MPEILDLDFTSLKQTTIAYLNKVNDSIALTIDKPEIEESKRSEYESDLQQIEEQINLVKNLELRMVIIAVMNAGKSTLINALIGQEILPTHGDSMTTLPTDVVLNSTLSEPILTLSTETVSVFKDAIAALQTEMKAQEKPERSGLDWAIEQTREYGHLASLLEKIHNNEIQLVEEVKGREAIPQGLPKGQHAAVLKDLNHIIRLCKALIPNHNKYTIFRRFC